MPLAFPGQYRDKETGLSYNFFRDYDPQTGRYVQSDPIGPEAGINTYLYVRANPLSAIDPEGLCTVEVRFWQYGWVSHSFIVVTDPTDPSHPQYYSGFPTSGLGKTIDTASGTYAPDTRNWTTKDLARKFYLNDDKPCIRRSPRLGGAPGTR